MNDVQFVEAARKFAERVMNEGGISTNDRIDFAFRSLLSRKPTQNEILSLSNLFEEYLSQFNGDPMSAKKLLSAGESPQNEQLNSSELAAWTMITHLLLNLSEAVTRG